VVFVYIHRWLLAPEPSTAQAPRLASEH
jgi:hypothetical protein